MYLSKERMGEDCWGKKERRKIEKACDLKFAVYLKKKTISFYLFIIVILIKKRFNVKKKYTLL